MSTSKNKNRIIKNIKTIRCHMQLTKVEFGVRTGIGKRAEEFETGRFRPSNDEIRKISLLANISPVYITDAELYTELKIIW